MCWPKAIIDSEAKNKISSQFILVFLQYQSKKPSTITELRLTLSCSNTFTVQFDNLARIKCIEKIQYPYFSSSADTNKSQLRTGCWVCNLTKNMLKCIYLFEKVVLLSWIPVKLLSIFGAFWDTLEYVWGNFGEISGYFWGIFGIFQHVSGYFGIF